MASSLKGPKPAIISIFRVPIAVAFEKLGNELKNIILVADLLYHQLLGYF